MFDSILMVCAGNICRSSAAEYIMRDILKKNERNISVSSAGLIGLEGKSADPYVIRLLSEQGIDAIEHKGRKLTSSMVSHNSILLVMESEHLNDLCALYPHARGKTFLLGHWNNDQEIPDPYGQSQEAFEYVYNLISDGCHAWFQHL
jgi:protein-tyrosine phosphatase